MKITSEQQLLDQSVRERIIKEEIYGDENRERKAQMLRRHEILKNKSKKWVMFGIEQEGFKSETVEQMRGRASNISVGKKIVNKLSQTYNGGVERKLGEPVKTKEKQKAEDGTEKEIERAVPNQDQVSMESLYDLLDFNTYMKKTDRFRTGFRNCLAGIVPVLDSYQTKLTGKPLFRLQMQVLAPWKYDVIEDPNDPTKPLAIIISEFTDRLRFLQFESLADGAQGIRRQALMNYLSDGKDAAIADRSEDKEAEINDRRFIWWTDGYHFTTNLKGDIIASASPPDLLNPIAMLPWETFAGDQDGSYWADGGDDIFETDILTNKKLTDSNFIQFIQGWGQLVIDAEGEMPKKLVGGPDNAWIFSRAPGAQPASVFYATSNPPIENWLESIRMILALCLSTNNLSPRNVSASLSVENAASGVVLMIENSELVGDVKDSQEYFRDKEPCLLKIASSWHAKYAASGWLVKEFSDIKPITNTDVAVKFHEIKPPISEKEMLEIMKLRKDLGIATIVDLLKKDNPDLTEEEAQKKAEELWEEKKKSAAFVTDVAKAGQQTGLKPGEKKPVDDQEEPEDDEEDDE